MVFTIIEMSLCRIIHLVLGIHDNQIILMVGFYNSTVCSFYLFFFFCKALGYGSFYCDLQIHVKKGRGKEAPGCVTV